MKRGGRKTKLPVARSRKCIKRKIAVEKQKFNNNHNEFVGTVGTEISFKVIK